MKAKLLFDGADIVARGKDNMHEETYERTREEKVLKKPKACSVERQC